MSSDTLKKGAKESSLSKVPKDIGCNNSVCIESENCYRALIAENGMAKEIKKFGGTPEKGCGKFLPIKHKK